MKTIVIEGLAIIEGFAYDIDKVLDTDTDMFFQYLDLGHYNSKMSIRTRVISSRLLLVIF